MSEQAVKKAQITVLAIFFLHGAVFSTWVSRIPSIKSQIGLSAAQLGLALLGVAAGSLVSMPLTGILIARYGSRSTTTLSSLGFCVALILPSLAYSQATLTTALCALGFCAGAMDVSMNTHAVAVEQLAGKPVLSAIHAAFSIGGISGAALGGMIGSCGITSQTHFMVVAATGFCVTFCVARGLLPGHVDSAPPTRRRLRFTPVLLGLAVITFCFYLAEGAIADWSGLYLRGSALGYAMFSTAMSIGRLSGDALRHRIEPRLIVGLGSAIAALGLAVALAFPATGAAGFAVVGAGCSIVVPVVFGAAGNLNGGQTGRAMAVLIMSGTIGLFAGPPAIGFAAEAFTLRFALLIVVGLLAAGVALAPAVGAAASRAPASVGHHGLDSLP